MDYKQLLETLSNADHDELLDNIDNAICAITNLLARAEAAESRVISQQIPASGTLSPCTIALHCNTWLPDMPCPIMRRTWGMLSPRSLSRLLQGLCYFFCALLFLHTPCFSPTPYWSEVSSVWKLYIYTILESRLFFRYPLKV